MASRTASNHRFHVGRCRARQSTEIVAALQHAHHAAFRAFLGNAPGHPGQVRKISVLKSKLSEWIAFPAVETRTHQHKLRTKLFHRRNEFLLKAGEDLRASASGWQRAIQRRALALALPGFRGSARPRIPWRLVHAEKEDGAVRIKRI